MQKPNLSDAHEKLSRARDHIANVEAQINAFLATDFYQLRFVQNQSEGRLEVIFDSLHQPTRRINSLIGDAIGNLRSTLDYLVVALAHPHTGKTDGTGFPFADDAKGFAGEVRAARCLGPCDVAIQNLFINEIQAYKGGQGHTFWVLNKLRNIDKHRLLLSATQIAGVTMSWKDRNGNVFRNCEMGIKAGQSGRFISAPLNHIQITDNPRPTFRITLEEPPVINNAPVIEFLQNASRDTETLLNRF